jgi:PII-like signaling protein
VTEALKLTIYHGERDRSGRRFVSDALADVFASHELRAGIVLRGVTGFGVRHALRTDRLLTLSEDLPLVSIAVDEPARVRRALADVDGLGVDGLVTLERARLGPSPDSARERKLTLYPGRGHGPRAAVEALHRHGVAGATLLLGVDGTAHGVRHRAHWLSRNADVPSMLIAVGASDRIAAALEELGSGVPATVERILVCKRDGERLAEPRHLSTTDPSGLARWQKLMVYASEQATAGGAPLYLELVRRLRAAGAAGATCLRGTWGYHGDHAPHGDTALQLRRRVPIVTVLVDTPANVRRWWPIVDELTAHTGLVTSETVPAYRARAGTIERGGLRLAELRP